MIEVCEVISNTVTGLPQVGEQPVASNWYLVPLTTDM
jgi:hypothetical protein